MKKIEHGVMVMKNGQAWGVCYEDGQCTTYGWIDPINAPIHNPKFCKKPTDATYKNSPYIGELLDANLVIVERKTKVEIIRNIQLDS